MERRNVPVLCVQKMANIHLFVEMTEKLMQINANWRKHLVQRKRKSGQSRERPVVSSISTSFKPCEFFPKRSLILS